MKLRFPIHIYDEGVELPEEGTYYVLARDGLYLRKDAGLIRAMVRVPQISALRAVEREAELRLPPLPARLVAEILCFFREVYDEHKTEAIVLLFWNEKHKKWLVSAPEQTVSPASLEYDKGHRLGNALLVGTAHSHADMSAFHSSTDRCDEEYFDGLHVTFGRMDEKEFELSSEIAVNGNRFPVLPEKHLAGIQRLVPDSDIEAPMPKKRLLDRIGEELLMIAEEPLSRKKSATPKFCLLPLPRAPSEDCGFPEVWMKRVNLLKLKIIERRRRKASSVSGSIYVDVPEDWAHRKGGSE